MTIFLSEDEQVRREEFPLLTIGDGKAALKKYNKKKDIRINRSDLVIL
jgi:hypothetical protein